MKQETKIKRAAAELAHCLARKHWIMFAKTGIMLSKNGAEFATVRKAFLKAKEYQWQCEMWEMWLASIEG